VKSTGAECEEKAGASCPGQTSPSGAHAPVVAGTGRAAALTSAVSAVSAAAPAGVQAGRDALAALAGVPVALAALAACGTSS